MPSGELFTNSISGPRGPRGRRSDTSDTLDRSTWMPEGGDMEEAGSRRSNGHSINDNVPAQVVVMTS